MCDLEEVKVHLVVITLWESGVFCKFCVGLCFTEQAYNFFSLAHQTSNIFAHILSKQVLEG
jgi:hypothetical protein